MYVGPHEDVHVQSDNIDEGIADIEAGRVVDGDEAEAFLDDWALSP